MKPLFKPLMDSIETYLRVSDGHSPLAAATARRHIEEQLSVALKADLELTEMAEHLRWALRRISTSLDCGEHYDRAEACLTKYDLQRACELPAGCRSPATCDDQGICCGALAGTDKEVPAGYRKAWRGR